MVGKLDNSQLHWADITVIVCYFVAIIAVGLWSSKKSARGSVSGYFLASHNMHWIPVGASIFASNIGSSHFVGLAGSGASTGIGVAVFELNAVFILMLLGWIFVPVYMSSGIYTMPEYLQKRLGGQRIRIYLSVLTLILYVFTKISADLFAGALFIEQSLNWNLYLSVILLLSIAAVFTIGGGLTAVIWTDFVQTILMLIGAGILMVKAFVAVGGYEEVWAKYSMAEPVNTTYNQQNQSCGKVPEDSLHLFRDASSNDLPWPGMIFGLTISSVWYWCSDQVIVQRALAAKDLSHAKAGSILAGYLKVLPLFMLVFPGMIARILYPDEIGCAVPDECERICGSRQGCTNIAYPLLVLRLMPTGLSGLMLSVMMAALMSSLTSIFNSSSTIFTIDIWSRIRKNPSEWEQLIVGRAFVAVLVAVSVVWIPLIKASQGSQLFTYIQSITSYLAPPVCAVYVLAILWPRLNEKGAFWSLMIGLAVGLIRFGIEFSYVIPACGSGLPDPRPEAVKIIVGNIHYLHFSIILFVLTLTCCVVISILTEPINEKCLYRLTFWTRYSTQVRKDIDEEEAPNHEPNDVSENGTAIGISAVSKSDLTIDAPHNGISTQQLTVNENPSQSLWKKAFFFICGVEMNNTTQDEPPKISPQEEAYICVKYLDERPLWRRLCNVNAVVLITIMLFIWGYYS